MYTLFIHVVIEQIRMYTAEMRLAYLNEMNLKREVKAPKISTVGNTLKQNLNLNLKKGYENRKLILCLPD